MLAVKGDVARISRLFIAKWWSRCQAKRVVVGPRRDLGRPGKRPVYTPSDTGTVGARLEEVTGEDGTRRPVCQRMASRASFCLSLPLEEALKKMLAAEIKMLSHVGQNHG